MADKTTIRRLPERGVTDRAAIHAILDEGFICHAAYVIDDWPVVIPTLYARDGNHLLLHGSTSMGLARAVRAGSPLSVAVTLIDGLVVARTGFHSSANYRSVVIHGQGQLLSGTKHAHALDVILEALIPGRADDIRSNTDAELKQTSVIQVSLAEASTKVRTGDPKDDPEDLNTGVWAGVIPMSLQPSTPVPAADLEDGVKTPDYLIDYTR